jgi:hypothetical protein
VLNTIVLVCLLWFFVFRLHAMMREQIGGELVRWNATRFGTIFIFLESSGTDKISLKHGWCLMSGPTVRGGMKRTMNSHMIV